MSYRFQQPSVFSTKDIKEIKENKVSTLTTKIYLKKNFYCNDYFTKKVRHHIDLNHNNNHSKNFDYITRWEHIDAHFSQRKLMKDFFSALFRRKIIIYDKKEKKYKINSKKIKNNYIKIKLPVGKNGKNR